MGRWTGKKCRLLSMLWLTTLFFFVEIVVGYITNSMALVADSFHMLSDVAALVVAFVSVRMSPKKWSKNTFGWARAEVLGALVNAVFLVALCFSITVEACKRFIEVETIHDPQLLVVVGGLGLLVNLIGLLLFHEHGSGHGHSHGGLSHSRNRLTQLALTDDNENDEAYPSPPPPPPPPKAAHGHSHGGGAGTMNMRGVFLHVLSDALGSVIVIVSALVFWLTDWKYKFYIDPALSLLLVLLILRSVWPLLRESALILLQTVPTHIQVDAIQQRLLQNVDGVLAVHEFHVWQLAGDRIIASAHIRCRNLSEYMKIAEKVKEFFHNEGIHSTTIQPEFIDYTDIPTTSKDGNQDSTTEDCVLDCPKNSNESNNCVKNTCCGPSKTSSSSSDNSAKSSPRHRLRIKKLSVKKRHPATVTQDDTNNSQQLRTGVTRRFIIWGLSKGRDTPTPNNTPYLCRQRNSANSVNQGVSEMEEGNLLEQGPEATLQTDCDCSLRGSQYSLRG